MWYVPIPDNTFFDLMKSSPVPIKFVDEMGKSNYENARLIGIYRYGNSSLPKIKPHIKILNSLNKCEKLTTLLHEISHAKCHKKNCKCHLPTDKSEAEIHAFEYTLKWLLKNKRKKALKWEIGEIKILSKREDCYGKAATHIIKLKLWQKCLNYVGKI